MTQIVSSISSLEIYAPSAGSSTYAKCDTNGRALTKMVTSADVSAYQVVSATGSQLYAGTAHLTSVNEAPISAARAGNAANAGMANSAYYDGAGRLISSLTDSATVSAIASSYASSKADASSLSSYALSADVSGVIDTVSSNSASWAGGGGVDSATVSAIASSYAESAVSSKLDTSAQVVTATAGDGTYVTSINGMGLSGQGGGGAGDYLEKSAQDVEIGNWNSASAGGFTQGSYNTAGLVSFAQGGSNNAYSDSFAQGSTNSAYSESFAQGYHNTAYSDSFAQGNSSEAYNESFVQGVSNSASNHSFAQGNTNSAYLGSFAQGNDNTAYSDSFAQGDENYAYSVSFAQGRRNSAINTAAVFGQFNLHGNGDTSTGDSAAFAIGDGTANGARHDLMLVTKDGEITMYSSTADTVGLGLVSSIKAISANAGGPVTATASAAAKAYTSTSTSVSSFTGISSINGSALLARNLLPNAQQATGNAHFHFMPTQSPWGSTEYTGVLSPLQYATGAALAMKEQGAYGAYYKGNEWFISDVGTNTAANGVIRAELHRTRGIHLYGSSLNSATGFHLNGSGVNGQSGASSWQYGPTEYNMLIDVNDTVSTQSANWGGSALALSAGPGVKLEKVGNTLVAGLDETVLWSSTDGSSTTATACTLSEAWTNFDHIDIWYKSTDGRIERASLNAGAPVNTFMLLSQNYNGTNWWVRPTRYSISDTEISANAGAQYTFTDDALTRSNTAINNRLYKVIGVNRTAGV